MKKHDEKKIYIWNCGHNGRIDFRGGILGQHIPLETKIIWKIYRDRPSLFICKDSVERADIIRDWVYENTIMAGARETYSDENARLFLEKTANGEDVNYGYYCGGIASVLSLIYTWFGYDACSLDMAVFSEDQILASHVVTLIHTEEGWIIEDATFNLTYVDEDKRRLDVTGLRENIFTQKFVGVKRGESMFRRCIMPSEKYAGIYELQKGAEYIENGNHFFIQKTDINQFLQFGLSAETLKVFETDGYPVNAAVFYMYPYAIYCPQDSRNNEDPIYMDLKELLNIQ